MKEITSSYGDLEKRLAIFLGLGAIILLSLYNLYAGATLFEFLVRGLVAFLVFSLAGFFYGHYLSGLVAQDAPPEQHPDGVEVAVTDVKPLGEFTAPVPTAPPAEVAAPAPAPEPDAAPMPRTVDFTLPELSPEPMPGEPARG